MKFVGVASVRLNTVGIVFTIAPAPYEVVSRRSRLRPDSAGELTVAGLGTWKNSPSELKT